MSIDEAIKNLNKVVDGDYELAFVSREEQKQVLEWLEDYKRLVTQQLTTCDINKVIEELELHSFELGTDTLPAHYVRLNDAVDIVKRGVVNE